MKIHSVVIASICSLITLPALAASPAADAAARALSQLEADSGKMQSYCKIMGEMDAAGDDEAKFDALNQQMEDLFKSFGAEYEQVMVLSNSADLTEEDGKVLGTAFDKLDNKCAK